MLDFIRETCVSICVETSPATNNYVSSLAQALAKFLHAKSLQSHSFTFNIARFSRDVVFWENEVPNNN